MVCDHKPMSSSTIKLVGGKTNTIISGNTTYEGNVLYNDKPIWYETPYYIIASFSIYASLLLVTLVGMIMMQKLYAACLGMEPLEVMPVKLQNMGNYQT